MEIPAIAAKDTPEDKAARRKSRWKARRNLVLTAVFLLGLGTANLVRDERNFQQWHREAAQYRQDCATPGSPSCRTLPLRVSEHTSKVSLDPDDDQPDVWLGLQDSAGRNYRVQIRSPQWDQLKVGDTVTAVVWQGKVEKITGGGEAKETLADPALRAGGARSSILLSWGALGFGAALVALLVWAETRIDKVIRAAQSKVRAAQSGNKTFE